MIVNFLRVLAWALLIGIVILTFVPPTLRVVTRAPHAAEHGLIFLASGAAFGLAYGHRMGAMCAAAVVFCAGLEVLQLGIPGRHARVSDFLIDAIATCMGIAIAS